MATLSISTQIFLARVMIEKLSANELIVPLIARVGTGEQLVREGQTLLEAVQLLAREQSGLEVELFAAWRALHRQHAALWPAFCEQRVVAQIRIKDIVIRKLLQLKAPYALGRPRQLRQMLHFYRSAHDDAQVRAALLTYGITEEELSVGHAAALAMEKLSDQIGPLNSRKKEATHKKSAALAKLDAWRRTTYKLIEYLTEDRPQLRQMFWEPSGIRRRWRRGRPRGRR